MAAHYFNTVENNVTGKPVASAEVTVLTAPSASGGTEVTIYSDEALSVTIDNPITTDSKGFFEFYTSADSVCLEIAYGGTTQKVIDNVNLVGGTVSTDVSALQVRMDAAEAVTQDPMIVDIAALTDPGADRIAFWDESANEITWLGLGTNLSITGTTINAAASGATLADGDYGDITASSSGTVLAIDNDAVTYAKMQNVSAASKLLGRGDSGSGDVQEITLGTGLSMSGTTLSAAASSSDPDLYLPEQWSIVAVIGSNTFSAFGTSATGTNVVSAGFSDTDYSTRAQRAQLTTANAANSGGSLLAGSGGIWPKQGGTLKARFVIERAISDGRLAVGMISSYTGTADPSASANSLILGKDTADTNLQIMHNDASGTATKIDLGANFPNSTGTGYEVTFTWNASLTSVDYTVRRLDTVVSDATGTLTTNLPVATTANRGCFASGTGSGAPSGGITPIVSPMAMAYKSLAA